MFQVLSKYLNTVTRVGFYFGGVSMIQNKLKCISTFKFRLFIESEPVHHLDKNVISLLQITFFSREILDGYGVKTGIIWSHTTNYQKIVL